MAQAALYALQEQIAEAEAIKQNTCILREAMAAIQKARQVLSNADLSAQGSRPNWTRDTAAVTASLDTLNPDVLGTAVFITVKEIGKKR